MAERLGDRFDLQRLLDEGELGKLYEARDVYLGGEVAIRILPPGVSREVWTAFVQDTEAVALVANPVFERWHSYGEHEGRYYVAGPLIRGESLRDRLGRGPLPWPEAVAIVTYIARALHDVHQSGVVHLDLRPEQIALTDSGVKLRGFGLSRLRGLDVVGTIAYVAPERITAEEADARTEADASRDVYALGAILYEAIAGHVPFHGPKALRMQVMFAAGAAEMDMDPIRALAPREIAFAVEKALARLPANRFPSAEALADVLFRAEGPLGESTEATGPPERLTRTLETAYPTQPSVGGMGEVWDTMPMMATPMMHLAVGKALNIEPEPAKHYTVTVYYATDRKPTGESDPMKVFGSARQKAAQPLSYGRCEVSVPYDHRRGRLEHPVLWLMRWDPEKHVYLLSVVERSTEEFFSDLRSVTEKSARKEAFVFIHGYCNRFGDAARRAAQIAYDLRFDGAPILYSWPSRGWKRAYPCDETNAKWTVPHFRAFLQDVSERIGAERIHIIAHSMGNFVLTEVLREAGPALHEVIFTAPDIDADVFQSAYAALQSRAERFTLYASSNDVALRASKWWHGSARAGESGDNLLLLSGLDTIDASKANTDFMGHSYFAQSVLADVFDVFKGEPPQKRYSLRPRSRSDQTYWSFEPA